jgi:hypothetical protein
MIFAVRMRSKTLLPKRTAIRIVTGEFTRLPHRHISSV